MPQVQVSPRSRVTYDTPSGAMRSWFDPAAPALTRVPFSPAELAREVLQDSASLFRWTPDLPDLRPVGVRQVNSSYSARWRQEHRGVPVDASEVVVNLFADARVHSIYNHYHYDIPDELDPEQARVEEEEARALAGRLLGVAYETYEVRDAELIVYQYQRSENAPQKPVSEEDEPARPRFMEAVSVALKEGGTRPREGQYFLAWDVTAIAREPTHSWRILIDATTGRLLNVIDLLQYATGTAKVFDPNPIVTSGDVTLSSGSPVGTINAQVFTVSVDRLNAAVGGQYHLDGSYVHVDEIESPAHAEPTSATGDFTYPPDNRDFLASMVYYHIDRFQDHIQTQLGVTNVGNFSIPVDPQGYNGADNSRYDPVGKNLAFGEGGIPDAADAAVVLHEYGHALQDDANPGMGAGAYAGGVTEGFGDFLYAVFYDDKHANPAATRGLTFPWDANPTDGFWSGRRYDVAWLFDGPEFAAATGHGRGQAWSAAMFELYRKLGGDSVYAGRRGAARDLAIRLHLIANGNVPATYPAGTTPQQIAAAMAQEVEAADSAMSGWRYAEGLHTKVVYDTFRRRHVEGYIDLPVDVYVDDGRAGGYGSASGNDLFNEKLWDENFWNTQDIWVRTTPYANAAAQAAGTAADHVEPPVGSSAYLYVRVKNRGTDAAGSGPVTVKAFHCIPGMGLVWPDDWAPMDTPSITVTNVLPGAAGEVVGPFPWTPVTVGHECVLVVLECANDPAVTQSLLASDHVPHSDLVPFDNNIAQRNLVPTMPKGRSKFQLLVRNPFSEVKEVVLRMEGALPEGWRSRMSLANESFRLGPLERRTIEVTIDQADGQEVTRFEEAHAVTIIGTIDDTVIGGVTYYIAPPEVFIGSRDGGAVVPGTTDTVRLTGQELLSLNIPWQQVDFEGEIDARIRFRRRD